MGYTGFAFAAVAVAVPAAPAAAQNVLPTPQSVSAALQAAGYKAEVGKDGTGDPMVTSSSSGTRFGTLFYGCTDHTGCTNIQFTVSYDLAKGTSADRMDAWNAAHRFGRAFLDKDQDPVLAMDLDLDKGGLSKALFQENLNTWISLMTAFEKHIDWAK
jgi:hypothetical protein